MNVYCLYFPNGKRYVGIESKTGDRITRHRRGDDRHHKPIPLVTKAILKHGWSAIRWRYLVTNCSSEDGLNLERYFIKLFGTQDHSVGYNLSAGGELSHFGIRHSEETKRRISLLKTGSKATPEQRAARSAFTKGRKHTPATRKILSGIVHGFHAQKKAAGIPYNNGLKGYIQTEEHKKKRLEARRTSNKSGTRSSARCLETGIVFRSIQEAAHATGVNPGCISQCCRGKLRSAGGLHWERVQPILPLSTPAPILVTA